MNYKKKKLSQITNSMMWQHFFHFSLFTLHFFSYLCSRL